MTIKKVWYRRLNWITVFATACLIDCSYIPGRTGLAPIGVMIWGFFLLWSAYWHCRKNVNLKSELPIAGLLALSILCLCKLPVGIGLYLSLPAFYQFLQSHNLKIEKPFPKLSDRSTPIRLGAYNIEDYSIDKNGSVYFFTNLKASSISSRVSYGFVYKPSDDPFPSLRMYYKLDQVFGNWYTFEVGSPEGY